MAEVRPVRSAIAIVGSSEDEDVVATTEGILVNGDGTKRNIGVIARGLVGGGAIEVPVGELAHVSDLVRERPALGTKPIIAVDPNVFGLDAGTLRQGKVGSKKVRVVGGRRHDDVRTLIRQRRSLIGVREKLWASDSEI
jgi:hypothetical protein